MELDPSQVAAVRASKSPIRRFGAWFDVTLTRMFAVLGGFVADRPYAVIWTCVAVAVLLAFGIARVKVQTNGEELYTPQGNQAFKDRDYVQALYGYGQVEVQIFATSPRAGGQSVLTKPALLALLDLWKTLSGPSVVGSSKGVNYTFQDPAICYRPGGPGTPCDVRSVLDFWQYSRAAIEADADIAATVSNTSAKDALGRPLSQQQVMGGIARDGATNRVAGAAAFQLVAQLQNNKGGTGSNKRDKRTDAWQRAAQKPVEDFDQGNGAIHVVIFDDWNQNDTASRTLTNDISLLFVGYILLLFYGVLVLSRPHPVQSRGVMALANIASIALAVLATFGGCMLVGVKFSLVVQLLALLLLGLGTDDMLVTIAAHEETGREMPGATHKERIIATVSRARRGVIVASFTNFAAFCTGTSTALPALSNFMIYAAVGVIFVLIFQSTFYIACITLDLRRQDANKLDCLTCKTSTAGPTDGCCGRPYLPAREPPSQRLIGRLLPRIILHPAGKVVVLAITVFFAVMGAIGAGRVKENFSNDDFIPKGTYVSKALRLRNEYFAFSSQGAVPFGVYTKNLATPPLDYFGYQGQLAALYEQTQADPFVNAVPPLEAWYPSFISWLRTSSRHVSQLSSAGLPPSSADFYAWLGEYLGGAGSRFKEDIVFSNTSSTPVILSSRYAGFLKPQKHSTGSVDAMRSTRKVARTAAPDLGAISYAPPFLFYEGYAVIAKDTVRSILIAAAIVFVIILVMLADFTASICVGLMVALVDLELVGFLHWAGLAFNSVTSINLLIAIGIAVDYSAFTAFSFMTRFGTRDERARKALANFGVAVFNGGFTMFLAVLPAAAASSFVFQTFFKMFAMIVALGLWHGLIVLPVVLSFVGPPPLASAMQAAERAAAAAELTSNPPPMAAATAAAPADGAKVPPKAPEMTAE